MIKLLTFLCSLLFAMASYAVEYKQIGQKTWMYTSMYIADDGSEIPSNGVIVLSARKAIVIDAPHQDADMHAIADWIESQNRRLAYVVPQHWHADSTGSLETAIARGAKVMMLKKTHNILKENGRNIAARTFDARFKLTMDRTSLELMHFGEGHSSDSLIAWVAGDNVLVGGCLIKAYEANSLGFTGDANLSAYPHTLTHIKSLYPEARIVTPGHGAPGNLGLIDHTLKLINQHGRTPAEHTH
jgi:metallo-beta-lactamase class B